MRITGLIVLVVAAVTLFITAYTIDETEQAIIIEFGRPVDKPVIEAGLHFKMPWRQLVKFDNRILEYDVEPKAILSLDKKRLEVDNYARWRIGDPLIHGEVGNFIISQVDRAACWPYHPGNHIK
ncbi:MAG TPA: hypothetical protein EYN59_08050 [Candidatus Marinimicrobia bacterium]|nr:hypothetical protein [Candidatus Neomarinimicrobiota bacterium]